MPGSGSPTLHASSSRLWRKLPDQVGFAVLPRRWVVERFFAWIGRNRRLAKDFEGTVASATAFLYAADVMLLAPQAGSFGTRFQFLTLDKEPAISRTIKPKDVQARGENGARRYFRGTPTKIDREGHPGYD